MTRCLVFIKLDLLLFIFHRFQKSRCLLRTHLTFLFRFSFGFRGRLFLFRLVSARAFDIPG